MRTFKLTTRQVASLKRSLRTARPSTFSGRVLTDPKIVQRIIESDRPGLILRDIYKFFDLIINAFIEDCATGDFKEELEKMKRQAKKKRAFTKRRVLE